MINKGFKGFTLAEVLITLGIVGVIAAVTMPTLIAKHQKVQTITKLKKAYSEFGQALQRAEADYGTTENWNLVYAGEEMDEFNLYFFNTYLKPYLSVVRVCEYTDYTKCWAKEVKSLANHPDPNLNNPIKGLAYITKAGYSVLFWTHFYKPQEIGGGHYIVDVNGPQKGPNILGKDIFRFEFVLTPAADFKGLRTYGLNMDIDRETLLNHTRFGCSRNIDSGDAGGYCAALIQYDGWKIEKDYPW